MRRYRILLLTHEQNIPPDTIDGLSEKEIEPFVTEFNVYETLCNLGHHVRVIGVGDRLSDPTTSTSWRTSK